MKRKIMDIDAAFMANTIITKNRDGYEVRCKKGLWGVAATSKQRALNEARHYFIPYFADG